MSGSWTASAAGVDGEVLGIVDVSPPLLTAGSADPIAGTENVFVLYGVAPTFGAAGAFRFGGQWSLQLLDMCARRGVNFPK